MTGKSEVWNGSVSPFQEKYPEIKKIGRIVSLNFENILKIDIDCSFDKELSIEKVHDLTSEIEHIIREEIKNAVITIHPEPIWLDQNAGKVAMHQKLGLN